MLVKGTCQFYMNWKKEYHELSYYKYYLIIKVDKVHVFKHVEFI